MEFQHEKGCVFCTDDGGKRIAEVTFPNRQGVAHINHTFVDPSLRGQGVADKLVSAAVGQIREDELKVVPICSYARKWFEEHPEHADLLARGD